MTYQRVAELAGVSTATVSRVLSGTGRVTEARRERVLAAVEQLSYRSNRAARTLRRQKADTLGVILSDIEYPFCATIARSVETAAAGRGLGVFVCNTDENLEREQFYIDLMIAERVSGVIISPSVESASSLDALSDAGIPVVTVDRVDPSGRFDAVLLDNHTATRDLAADLLEHGHRRFLAMIGTTDATPSRERLESLQLTLREVTGTHLVIEESHLQDTVGLARTMGKMGRRAFELIAASDSAPTAVLCANAVMVISVLDALLEAGVRVPEDVAVVGYDDMPAFRHYASPVTVAAQPAEVMGQRAAALIFDRMVEPNQPVRTIRLAPQMEYRRSCGLGHSSSEDRPAHLDPEGMR